MSEKRVSTTDFEDSVQICLQDEKPVVLTENTKHELSVKACRVKNVTVFVDRAEVNRIVETNKTRRRGSTGERFTSFNRQRFNQV